MGVEEPLSEYSTPSKVRQDIGAPGSRLYPRRVSKPFLALLIGAATAVFVLVTIGGTVRVTESGLGCPDWPLCHGEIIPPLDFHTLLEYSHRLAASVTSPLILLSAIVAWWRYRDFPLITVPLTATAVLLAVEVVLGGITVLTELPPAIVTVHLAVAESIFALLLTTLVWYWTRTAPVGLGSLRPWAGWGAAVTFLVLLSGSYIVGQGAGSACTGWPLCNGGVLPNLNAQWAHMAHRIIAIAGGIFVLMLSWKAWRARNSSAFVGWAGLSIGLLVVGQTTVGAANPWTGFSEPARVAHLSLATGLWGATVVMVAKLWRPSAEATATGNGRLLLLTVADYLVLAKPLIIMLLLVTATGGMFLAANGPPPASLVFWVLFGGALGAGGANAINHFLDQDLDEAMTRTRQRPLPGQRVSPRRALVYGVVLNVAAFFILLVGANLLAAVLTIVAGLFYVFVYTMWLKRTTTQNIVIGGAAGAFPPLVGWAAVTGGLDIPALYLFGIVFFWTPPHFWALAIMIQTDYAKAKVPMLPVVAGVPKTTRYILLHSAILVALSLMLFTTGAVGWVYLASASILGAYFLFRAWRLFQRPGIPAARRLYLYSLVYLASLFFIAIIGATVGV